MENSIKQKGYMAITGALTGLANGFFGGGGGMIVVPLMIYLLKIKTKTAHATALAVILPITLISALVYFLSGKFDFKVGVPSLVGVVLGGIIGAWLLGKLSADWLTKIFSLVMLVAGVKALVL
ncbi:MAG: sulfite exporter TauE/SafE family protein [Clostridia bacterium]|nr:sulfite exporter TauE/SafE family protein [Clostridia bacterium]